MSLKAKVKMASLLLAVITGVASKSQARTCAGPKSFDARGKILNQVRCSISIGTYDGSPSKELASTLFLFPSDQELIFNYFNADYKGQRIYGSFVRQDINAPFKISVEDGSHCIGNAKIHLWEDEPGMGYLLPAISTTTVCHEASDHFFEIMCSQGGC